MKVKEFGLGGGGRRWRPLDPPMKFSCGFQENLVDQLDAPQYRLVHTVRQRCHKGFCCSRCCIEWDWNPFTCGTLRHRCRSRCRTV